MSKNGLRNKNSVNFAKTLVKIFLNTLFYNDLEDRIKILELLIGIKIPKERNGKNIKILINYFRNNWICFKHQCFDEIIENYHSHIKILLNQSYPSIQFLVSNLKNINRLYQKIILDS